MELLDRYLLAVRKHLRWQRQDDIIAELRANLESQLEEKEAAFGRPLTQGEAEDWLRELGPPIQVAARYSPQQYLIGPTFFPTYWYVLRMALGWSLAIYAVVSAAIIAAQMLHAGVAADHISQTVADLIAQAIARAPGILISVAAWVTGVFAGLEFATARGLVKLPPIPGMCRDWNPNELPRMEESQSTHGKKPRSYAMAVGEVVFGIFLLTWLLLVPYHPYLLMGPGAAYLESLPYRLAPVWWTFYWWIVALNLVQLGWRFIDLARGTWQGPRTVQNIVSGAMGLIPLVVLLTARDHVYVVLKDRFANQLPVGMSLHEINLWAFRGMLVILVISGLNLLAEIGKAGWGSYRNRVVSGR